MARTLKTHWPWLLVLLGYCAWAVLFFVTVEAAVLRVGFFVFSFFAIQFTAVFLHEMGHLLACIAIGDIPATLVIGTGPLLEQFRLGPVTFRFNSTTNSGLVASRYRFETFHLANFHLLYASGPLMDLLALAGVIFCLVSTPEVMLQTAHYDEQIKPLLIIAGSYLFYCHLSYLLRKSSYSVGAYSDAGGLTTLRPILAAPEEIRRACITVANAHDHITGKFSDPLPPSFFNDMEMYHRWTLDQPNITPEYADILKDSFVTTVLLYGWEPLLPLADAYSAQLLESSPDSITYKGSRGSVLIDLGKLHEGKALLEEVFTKSKAKHDRCIAAAFLAIAEYRLDNIASAEAWLEKAAEIDPESHAVTRARNDLSPNSSKPRKIIVDSI